ncbi:MAG: YCF48-related protein [bacterium]
MKKLLIIVILLLTFNTLSAQKWTVLASGTDNALNSVYFTNADSGYAVGTNGTILKTMNGGAAWTNISSGINKQLNDVYFTDL